MPSVDTAYTSANHHKYTTSNRLYQWHLRVVKEQLLALVDQASPSTVLDAGCGEGFVAGWLAGQRPDLQITGVDLSGPAIEYAKESWGDRVKFRTGSVYKLPFSDRSFDLVMCCEVLEHLDEPVKAIRELKRVARKYVLITVPLEPYFNTLNVLGQRIGVSVDPEHVNFWTKETFQKFIGSHFQNPQFAWRHIYQYALIPV